MYEYLVFTSIIQYIIIIESKEKRRSKKKRACVYIYICTYMYLHVYVLYTRSTFTFAMAQDFSIKLNVGCSYDCKRELKGEREKEQNDVEQK